MSEPPTATILVAPPLPQVLHRLATALDGPVVLVGGWAVQLRLRMARFTVRATEDLDVILAADQRPARAALAAVDAVQRDPRHPCRLEGLPLSVDVLTADEPALALTTKAVVEDDDGLHLLKPPMGPLLARTAERVQVIDDTGDAASVLLPLAGALLASKVQNLALEDRPTEKLASDADDVVALLNAFGTLALVDDLDAATVDERAALRSALETVGASAIVSCARGGGAVVDEERVGRAVEALLEDL